MNSFTYSSNSNNNFRDAGNHFKDFVIYLQMLILIAVITLIMKK